MLFGKIPKCMRILVLRPSTFRCNAVPGIQNSSVVAGSKIFRGYSERLVFDKERELVRAERPVDGL
jgi:hypothetical protein